MQPRCNVDAGTVRQQIERTPALQVDQERAVSTPLAKRPIINADDARGASCGQRQAANQAQHGIRTGRHTQIGQEASAGFAAEGDTDTGLRPSEAARASCPLRQELGQGFHEGAAATLGMLTVEASNLKTEADSTP